MKGNLYSAQLVGKLYERSPTFIAREEVLKLAQQEKHGPLSYFTISRPVLYFIRQNFPCTCFT